MAAFASSSSTTSNFYNVLLDDHKGILSLTLTHLNYTIYESKAPHISIPWPNVANLRVSPPSFSIHKLKVSAYVSSNGKRSSHAFVFPDRQSLETANRELEEKLRSNNSGATNLFGVLTEEKQDISTSHTAEGNGRLSQTQLAAVTLALNQSSGGNLDIHSAHELADRRAKISASEPGGLQVRRNSIHRHRRASLQDHRQASLQHRREAARSRRGPRNARARRTSGSNPPPLRSYGAPLTSDSQRSSGVLPVANNGQSREDQKLAQEGGGAAPPPSRRGRRSNGAPPQMTLSQTSADSFDILAVVHDRQTMGDSREARKLAQEDAAAHIKRGGRRPNKQPLQEGDPAEEPVYDAPYFTSLSSVNDFDVVQVVNHNSNNNSKLQQEEKKIANTKSRVAGYWVDGENSQASLYHEAQHRSPSRIKSNVAGYWSDELDTTNQQPQGNAPQTTPDEEEGEDPLAPPQLQRQERRRQTPQPGAIAVTPNFPTNDTLEADVELDGTNNEGEDGFNDELPDPREDFLVQATLVESQLNLTTSQRLSLEEDTRRRMMDELVVDVTGDAIPFDPEETERKLGRRVAVVVVIALVLIGVVIGSVLGTRESPDEVLIVITPEPTVSGMPSASPSAAPTSSAQPSQRPTDQPSSMPSSSPSKAPDNRYCSDAEQIFVGTSILTDTYPETKVPSDYPTPDFGSFTDDIGAGTGSGNIFARQGAPTDPALPGSAEGATLGGSNNVSDATTDDVWSSYAYSNNNDNGTATDDTWTSYAFNYDDDTPYGSNPNIPADYGYSETTGETYGDYYDSYNDDDRGDVVWTSVVTCHTGYAYGTDFARWYRMRGIGPATVTTCTGYTSIDADIQVFTDTNGCPSPGECVSDLDYGGGFSSFGGCTTVSWMSRPDTEYLILVAKNTYEGAGGYDSYWSDGYSPPASLSVELFNNDFCDYAYRPLQVPWPKQSYVGFLTDATPDANVTPAFLASNATSCGTASAPEEAGVWYAIDGIDGLISADTCTGTLVDTQITVYKGDCSNLECVEGNDNGCGDQSAVSWNGESGVTYYILVHGGTGVSSGSFELTIQSQATIQSQTVSNNKCGNAVPLALDHNQTSLLVDVPLSSATVDPEVGFCVQFFDYNFDYGRGLWYTFVGTPEYSYDFTIRGGQGANVAVSGESCENIQDECFMHDMSDESLTTEEGKTYLVYVFYTSNSQSLDAQLEVLINKL